MCSKDIISTSSSKWLETEFQDLVQHRRAAVSSKTFRQAAMSDANGILTILKALNGNCSPDDIFSLGVLCSGAQLHVSNMGLKFKYYLD